MNEMNGLRTQEYAVLFTIFLALRLELPPSQPSTADPDSMPSNILPRPLLHLGCAAYARSRRPSIHEPWMPNSAGLSNGASRLLPPTDQTLID